MSALLTLNSAAFSLTGSGSEATAVGAAFVDGEVVLLGDAALERCRLAPRQSHTGYVERLNSDALAVPGKTAQSQADLIYLQLRDLASQTGLDAATPVLAAIPATANSDQLGLLLGIAQEAGIAVQGFADRAVLDAADLALPERCAHLDVHLGGLCLTRLERRDSDVVRADGRWLPECGLLSIADTCVTAIAERFIDDHRFDPLKIASTEQQLFDQVRSWFGPTLPSELAVEVSHEGSQRRLDAGSDLLIEATRARYADLLVQLSDLDHILMTPTARQLPGLDMAMASAGKTVSNLGADASQNTLRAHADRLLSTERVMLTTTLPASAPVEDRSAPIVAAASHVLVGSKAYPINGAPIDGVRYRRDSSGHVSASADSELVHGSTRNTALSGLEVGASIRINQTMHLLIQVEQ